MRRTVTRQVITECLVPVLGKKNFTGRFELWLSEEATFLGLHEVLDREERRQWILTTHWLADPYVKLEKRHFVVAGITDKVELGELWNHLGSVHSRSGYIWHLFEVWE